MKRKQLGILNEDSKYLINSYDSSYIANRPSTINFYLTEKYIVIQRKSIIPLNQQILCNQQELPIGSVPWLVNTIENGFRRASDEGGLPPGVMRNEFEIDDERLIIRSTACAGGEYIHGFTILNTARADYIDETDMQESVLPDQVVDEALLPFLKQVIAERDIA